MTRSLIAGLILLLIFCVEEGQAVLILEAMKLQNEIKSPQKGRLTKIGPKAGSSVETGALLFSVE